MSAGSPVQAPRLDPGAEPAGERPIRVLAAKVGLDGHDRGVKVIARAYRDAGFEVIYTGLFRTPEEVARTVVDEDVDVVAISILSGAHNTLVPEVIAALGREGASDVPVLVGGTIPPGDFQRLKEAGVYAVFGPGSDLEAILQATRQAAGERRKGLAGGRNEAR